MWELVEALEVIRSLEKRISKVGWHVALAGGVLERGASDHDLDLVVFPDHNERRPPFYDAVVALGWKRTHTCLLYTSPSPRDRTRSRMPSSA